MFLLEAIAQDEPPIAFVLAPHFQADSYSAIRRVIIYVDLTSLSSRVCRVDAYMRTELLKERN